MQSQAQNLANNQVARRARTNLSSRVPRIGKVLFSQSSPAVQCSVKDFSKTHAVLTMSGWLGLPSDFTLFLEPDAIRAECKVVQRRGSNIKVEFTSVTDGVRYRP